LTLLVLSLFVITFASKVFRPAHECVRQRKCLSHDFAVAGPAPVDEKFTLSFAVKRANVDQLFSLVDDVSNPSSANYGKYWTPQQVRELTANPEATDAVVQFLSKYVDDSSIKIRAFGGFVEVDTDIKTAQEILGTVYHKFDSEVAGKTVYRTFSFVLPKEISEVVDYIFPTVQFPPTLSGKPLITSHGVPNANSVTPAILNSYYNITSNTVSSTKATQSLFESLGQSFSPSDLTQFQSLYKLPNDPLDTVIGPNTPTDCTKNPNNCAEANLDVQYIMAVAQIAPTTYWSEANSLGDIFYKWIVEVGDYTNPPLVHSISYGSIEDELEDLTQNRFNQEAASLGASGVTIVVSSGDDGVANFGARSDKSQCGFHPSYPASAQYVVAVGATKGPEAGQPEVACQSDNGGIITTGGGFSTTFSQPSYQSQEVNKFLSNSTACPPKTMFASGGRGYPDVSMAGYNYNVVIGGSIYQVSGTSASAPVFAGVLTLANNARFKKGKTAVGFVNPSLYSLFRSQASLYNDVTSGNNKCCAKSGVTPVCCDYGFYCTPGWDPVTGLGSVNVGRFVDALSNL
jgi:tripeptidyl-peptidase-1